MFVKAYSLVCSRSQRHGILAFLLLLFIACTLPLAASDPATGYENQDTLQHEDHLNDEMDSYPHDYTPLEIPFGTDMKIIVAPTITCTSNSNNTWHLHYNACKLAQTFLEDEDWSDKDADYTYVFEDWNDFDWNDIIVNIHASTVNGVSSDLAVTFREAAWKNPLGLEITIIGTWIRIEWNTTEHGEIQSLEARDGETVKIDLFAESNPNDAAYLRFLIPPTASFSWQPARPFVGETIVFDASTSVDFDGEIELYSWVFGDEASIDTCNKTIGLRFRSPGNHSVRLCVVDWSGLADCTLRELEILAVVGGVSTALDYALRTTWEHINFFLLLGFLIASALKRIK